MIKSTQIKIILMIIIVAIIITVTVVVCIKTFKKEEDKTPEINNEYLYILGMCYKDLKDFIRARDSFALAIEFDDKDYKSYYEYGLILDSTNKKEAALIMFEKAIKIKPDFFLNFTLQDNTPPG